MTARIIIIISKRSEIPMTVRPDIIPFSDFVNAHKEQFAPFELWIVDELTEFLVNKLDLDKSYTSIIVDANEEDPVGKITANDVSIRLNGRFYFPTEDRTGKKITLTSQEWADTAKAWFDETELEVSFDIKATDLLKFTVFVPALELPEGVGSEEAPTEEVAPESETSPSESEKPPEEGETPSEEETAPEGKETPEGEEEKKEEEKPEEGAPEGPAEKAPEEEDEELKDFEKALGI